MKNKKNSAVTKGECFKDFFHLALVSPPAWVSKMGIQYARMGCHVVLSRAHLKTPKKTISKLLFASCVVMYLVLLYYICRTTVNNYKLVWAGRCYLPGGFALFFS